MPRIDYNDPPLIEPGTLFPATVCCAGVVLLVVLILAIMN